MVIPHHAAETAPMTPLPRQDLARPLLAIAITAALVLGSLWVLSPFLTAFVWAIMIVVSAWPLMLGIERRLGRRRWLAVCVMILGLLVALLLPLTLAIATLVDNSEQIIAAAGSLKSLAAPLPPDWLGGLPYVGGKLTQLWAQGAALGLQGLATKAAPYAGSLTRWFAVRMGGLSMVVVQIVLAIAMSAFLFLHGEAANRLLDRFARRVGGDKAHQILELAAGAIRGVALGIGVTALVQALLGGIGLALTGIPFATVLTALMFMLCIAQIGVMPVLLPAIIWLYATGHSGWGTFLVVWTLVIVNLDNFLRPWLIRRGADLPLLLIFVGVIGGIISLGLVGIFIGPLLLAVSYTLLNSWLQKEPASESTEAQTAPESPPTGR
jgi:predicted PurR-regulated permease PerM